jgi:hypothetical protein
MKATLIHMSSELRHFSFFLWLGQKYLQYLQTCTNYKLQATFPNIGTTLVMFLTIPLSDSSGEKYFSVLRRVKTCLKSILCYKKILLRKPWIVMLWSNTLWNKSEENIDLKKIIIKKLLYFRNCYTQLFPAKKYDKNFKLFLCFNRGCGLERVLMLGPCLLRVLPHFWDT